MKTFKRIDLLISILLIVIFSVLCIIDLEYLFIGYVVVGGWQVISMLVHVWNRWFNATGSRRFVYHWITIISLVTMPIGSFWILLFTAPFMAVYYTWICYDEVYVKMQRPLAMLK